MNFADVVRSGQQEQGLTLIEVLVAVGILALVGATFITGMALTSKGSMVSQERVAVESLAKSQMEDTKAQDYVAEATSYPSVTLPGDLSAQGYAITVAAQPLNSPDDGIQRITVTVTRNEETLFTLVDYKVNR